MKITRKQVQDLIDKRGNGFLSNKIMRLMLKLAKQETEEEDKKNTNKN